MRSGRELPAYARHLKAALALQGWTMSELAAAIPPEYKLSKSTLDKIAQGQRPPADYEYPVIAKALEVPEYFLRGGLAVGPQTELDAAEVSIALARLPDYIGAAVLRALKSPEVRQALRVAATDSARGDTAARRRQLERDEPS